MIRLLWIIAALLLSLPSTCLKAAQLPEQVVDYEIEDGEVTITHCKVDGVIEIPDTIDNLPVTAIADGAFRNRPGIVGVRLPATVNRIGNSAFAYCTSLTSVVIPDSVTSIGRGAFSYCTALESVTLPEVLKHIEYGTFMGCASLTNISLPKRLVGIGENGFRDCTRLAAIDLPDNLERIEYQALYGCTALRQIAIPSTTKVIGHGAFTGCGLTNITVEANNRNYSSMDGILFDKEQALLKTYPGARSGDYTLPASVTRIADWAFACSEVTGLALPDSLTTLGENAFYQCARLTSIALPAKLERIGNSAFADSGLTNIAVAAENHVFSSREGVLYDKGQFQLVAFPSGRSGSHTTPTGVKEIAEQAFVGCRELTGLVLSEGVQTIGNAAFAGCENLREISLPSSLLSIGAGGFSGCSNLVRVPLPAGLTRVENATFINCYSLTNITLPPALGSIGDSAFGNCVALTDVYITGPTPTAAENAFAGAGAVTFHLANGVTTTALPQLAPPANRDSTSTASPFRSRMLFLVLTLLLLAVSVWAIYREHSLEVRSTPRPAQSPLPNDIVATMLMWSALVGFFVGMAGAGIYGSPLVGVSAVELFLRIVFLAACPAAALIALVVNPLGRSDLARVILMLGILLSLVSGLLTPFRHVWWIVYFFTVWIPMFIGIARGR